MAEVTQQPLDKGARKKIIREVAALLADLDAKRKAITDERKAVVQSKIKAQLGMKAADFATAYRLSLLEGEDRDQLIDTLHETFEALGMGAQLDWLTAAEKTAPPPASAPQASAPPKRSAKDRAKDEELERAVTDIQERQDAAKPIGDAAAKVVDDVREKRAAAAGGDEPTPEQIAQARLEGERDGRELRSLRSCPYPEGGALRGAWQKGWAPAYNQNRGHGTKAAEAQLREREQARGSNGFKDKTPRMSGEQAAKLLGGAA